MSAPPAEEALAPRDHTEAGAGSVAMEVEPGERSPPAASSAPAESESSDEDDLPLASRVLAKIQERTGGPSSPPLEDGAGDAHDGSEAVAGAERALRITVPGTSPSSESRAAGREDPSASGAEGADLLACGRGDDGRVSPNGTSELSPRGGDASGQVRSFPHAHSEIPQIPCSHDKGSEKGSAV